MLDRFFQADGGGGQGSRRSKEAGKSGRSGERGFAAMDPKQQREIASKGGKAVSADREHMAQIGRKGGEASHGGSRGRS